MGTAPVFERALTRCRLGWAAGPDLPIRRPASLSVSDSGFFPPSCDVGKVGDVWRGDPIGEVRDVLS